MQTVRKYGVAPFDTVVVHGGPGAQGAMKPVAEHLGERYGVLEPFQTEPSVRGQIDELRTVLEKIASTPARLIGHSWGAWLCCLLAAQYPELTRTLILVGSGPFEEEYAPDIMQTRLARLEQAEQQELRDALETLNHSLRGSKKQALETLARLCSKTDTYDAASKDLPSNEGFVDFRVFHAVFKEAVRLRRNGTLMEAIAEVQRPVVAIHGDYDPHPAQGVKKPLAKTLRNFRFMLLSQCGHEPWSETYAKDKFWRKLDQLLNE